MRTSTRKIKRKKIRSPETQSGERDYIQIAVGFAKQAIADKSRKRNCIWIRLAAQRFFADLKRAKQDDCSFKFDTWEATNACDFIEKLPHVEGKWGVDNIVLHPAHVFFVVNLFGFRNHDGTRRFTSALLLIGRKNAKSLIAAAILLYCLCCEDEPGPQVISAATTGDQARMIFKAAQAIVQKTAALRDAFGLEAFANAIVCRSVMGNFKPINSKASTQDGLNPSHMGIDEIHAHKTHDLMNVLKSAGGARKNKLTLYTTTEGYESPGPWPELRKLAQDILRGIIAMDHMFALLFMLDDAIGKPGEPGYSPEDDEFDESKWIKANPLIDVNPVLLKAIREDAEEAKQMPGKMAEFRIKRCNRRSASGEAWVNLTKWRLCNGEVDLKFLEGKPCFGGLDLASTTDLTAFRLVWRVDGVYYTYGMRWVPANAVAQRTERNTVPYAGWVEAGLIKQTDGDVVDSAVIEADIRELCRRFNPQRVGFDRWNAIDLVSRLQQSNLPMVEFRQGPKSYHPAMQELERVYISGNLRHGGDPVLTWCASNLVARKDQNLNMAPDKQKSADKIDDMTALLMAVGMAIVIPEGGDINDWLQS